MSEAVKKLPIKIKSGKQTRMYLVPVDKVKGIEKLIEEYRVEAEDSVSASDVLKDLDKKYSKVGNILTGYRLRDGLTQVQLAKKVKSSQSAIAAIENGSRKVGKTLAIKLAKIFNVDYQSFLDKE